MNLADYMIIAIIVSCCSSNPTTWIKDSQMEEIKNYKCVTVEGK